ncbi:uncharacterized protein LOC116250970 [Nymphaea colorata]|nr:uncharacterized protein LOC116250970 [Nymphaea colorata]
MGGRPADWVVCKPSRSDEVIPPEEQLRTAKEVQAHFDSMAPKRPQKPNRSEASTTADDSPPDAIHPIHDPPELEKLQTLRTESHTILADGRVYSMEEFVETDYYKRLNSIDKNHFTTGTGYIKVMEGVDGVRWRLEEGGAALANSVVVKTRTNPATNDWIPSEDQQMAFVSSKPHRSESEA